MRKNSGFDFSLNDNRLKGLTFLSVDKPFDCIQALTAAIMSKERVYFERINNPDDNGTDRTNIFELAYYVKREENDLITQYVINTDEYIQPEMLKYCESIVEKAKSFTEDYEYGKLLYHYGAQALRQLVKTHIGPKKDNSNSFCSPEEDLIFYQLHKALEETYKDYLISKKVINPEDNQVLYLDVDSLYHVISNLKAKIVDDVSLRIDSGTMLAIIFTALFCILIGLTLMNLKNTTMLSEIFYDTDTFKLKNKNFLENFSKNEKFDEFVKERYLTGLYLFKKIHIFINFYSSIFINDNLTKNLLVLASNLDKLTQEEKEEKLDCSNFVIVLGKIGEENQEILSFEDFLEPINPFNNFFTYYESLMGLNLPSKTFLAKGISQFINFTMEMNDIPTKYYDYLKEQIEKTNITAGFVKGLYDFLIGKVICSFPKEIDPKIIHILCVISSFYRTTLMDSKYRNVLKKEDVYNCAIAGLNTAESAIILFIKEWFDADKKYLIAPYFKDYCVNYDEMYELSKTMCSLEVKEYLSKHLMSKDHYIPITDSIYSLNQIHSSIKGRVSNVHEACLVDNKTGGVCYHHEYLIDFISKNILSPVIYAFIPKTAQYDMLSIKTKVDRMDKEDQKKLLEFLNSIEIKEIETPCISNSTICKAISSIREDIFEGNINIFNEDAKNNLINVLFTVLFNVGFVKDYLYDTFLSTQNLTVEDKNKIKSTLYDISPENLIPNIYLDRKYSF